ncbi:MAG: hypothetical protein JWN52_5426 [Actinomycetia bacterium]|nr:hypothetical protein [Actinomycetes bacterium]
MEASGKPVIGDTFGEALTRCWKAGAQRGVVHEIIERDDGFIAVGDVAAYFADRDEWPPAEQWAADLVTGRVLDVGCGAGRQGLVLAQAGHNVLGIDPSPGAIAVATERGLNASFGTATNIPADAGTFDTVLLLGNNLGLLESHESARVLLNHLASVTRRGGQLLGSSRDPHVIYTGDHFAYLQRNVQAGRMPGQTRLRLRDGFSTTGWFDYLYVSPTELAEIVEGTPWQLAAVEENGVDFCARLVRM